MSGIYQNWMGNYTGSIHRRCKEVSEEMQSIFPELRIAKGLVTLIDGGKEYQHQWLIDVNAVIVDSTADQWAGIATYTEIIDGESIPKYRCLNCGGWVFSDSTHAPFCSKECYEEAGKEEI